MDADWYVSRVEGISSERLAVSSYGGANVMRVRVRLTAAPTYDSYPSTSSDQEHATIIAKLSPKWSDLMSMQISMILMGGLFAKLQAGFVWSNLHYELSEFQALAEHTASHRVFLLRK